MNKQELQLKANEVRKGIVTAVHAAKAGHPGGSLSAADIFTYLYFEELNIDPKDPKKPDRDRFVLSKGHTAPGLYSALALRGYFPVEDLKTLRHLGSYLQGHPDMKHSGIEFRGIFIEGFSFFAFNHNFIRQTDNRSTGTVNCFLFHTEVVRAVGFGHFDLAVFYFAYIGAVYFDHLIFPKGIGAVFLAVYGNSNTSVIPAAGEIHATPEEQGKHHDANNKSQFFFLQFQYLSQKSMFIRCVEG